jgi:hypothetical protein
MKKRFPFVHIIMVPAGCTGVAQRGVRRGAVKRGAMRRGIGKQMVMILELRKTRRQIWCQLMYNVQWEFSRTRLSLIFLSALGQKLC